MDYKGKSDFQNFHSNLVLTRLRRVQFSILSSIDDSKCIRRKLHFCNYTSQNASFCNNFKHFITFLYYNDDFLNVLVQNGK